MAKRPKSPWIVSSIEGVAEHFGVSTTTVNKGWRPKGMPGTKKRWDLGKIAKWLAERLQSTGGGSGGRELSESDRLKLERLRNSVEFERIKIDERLGNLVDAQGAQLAQERQAAAFVGLLDRLPAEARAIVGLSKKHTDGLTECIRRLREDIARE